jgi:hypothetical protein
VAVIWQDRRVTFDGQRQRAALERFQEATELDATAIARAVGLSYPQYNRYRWGRLPLRTDQIPVFAAAYGVTTATLTQALGLMDDIAVSADDPAWDFRAELKRAKPNDPEGAARLYRELAEAGQDIQRAVIATIVDSARRNRDERDRETRSGQPRAVAAVRAKIRYGRTG